MRGLFIVFDGIEGAGKTTQLDLLRNYMEFKNRPVYVTREPGGTIIAEEIRDLVLRSRDANEELNAITELLLMFAARSQHVHNLITPLMKKGVTVLCDRFTSATYAYQSFARGLDFNYIRTLENMVQGTLRPDLTIILDVYPEEGLNRAKARGKLDRIEQEKVDFFRKARNGFMRLTQIKPDKYVIVNGRHDKDTVFKNVLEAIESKLGKL